MIDEIIEIESDIKKLENEIDLGISLKNLKNNKDFKKIILNGFLQDYVLDILYKESKIDFNKLKAAKTLNDYFNIIESAAQRAETNKIEYVKELNNLN